MDDDEGVAFEGETIKPLVERVRCPRALFRGPGRGMNWRGASHSCACGRPAAAPPRSADLSLPLS